MRSIAGAAIWAAALVGLVAPRAASASDLSVPVSGDNAQHSKVRYQCGESGTLTVDYINAGSNSLAVLSVRSERRLFVDVMSGSGVRYASGPYVWWTKGRRATLSDERQPSAPIVMDCAEVGD